MEKDSPRERRKFIKQSILAGAGATLLPFDTSAALNSSDTRKENASQSKKKEKITILITTDIHGQLFTHDEFFWENEQPVYRKRGGLAVLKTMVDFYRKQNPENTILYDGGDFFHGHMIASLTEGQALIPIFNALGYDLMLPGNWEVVYKKKRMLTDLGYTHAAKICANMWHSSEDSRNGDLVYPPYWIKYIAGIKLGIIGYTDHLIPKRQSPAYSEGLRFEHAQKSLAKYVKQLREEENCAIVLVATHMGLAQQLGLANNIAANGVDFILGADTHERLRAPIQGKYAKVIECGAFGSFLGKLDLQIENGRLTDHSYQLIDVDPQKFKADKHIEKLINEASKPFDTERKTVIGISTTPLVRYFVLETPMDNLITDAMMWKFNPDVALSNGFRFCQPLAVNPATGTAEITKEFLWNMLPVNSEVKIAKVSGEQLINWLEKELENAFAENPSKRFGGWFVRFNGMQVKFIIGNEQGKRVQSVEIQNKPLERNLLYTVTACEREGDPEDTLCRIEGVQNPKLAGADLHQVVEEYLKVHSPVAPKLDNRAIALDASPNLLTQLRGTSYEFR